MNKIEIIPAILPGDFNEIYDKASQVKGSVNSVQVDICDGRFVASTTWPYKNEDGTFERLLLEKEGLPFWQEVDYEFDLMVDWKNPSEVERWIHVGASRLVIHMESKGDLGEVVKYASGVEVGMALNIDTDIAALEPYKESIQFIQLMGIDHVGFQGQEFDPKVIERIKEAEGLYPDLPVSIDGGVSLANAKALIDAGADRLIVGSAIYESDNIIETIRQFNSINKE